MKTQIKVMRTEKHQGIKEQAEERRKQQSEKEQKTVSR